MTRAALSLEELYQLIPELEELEALRCTLLQAAIPDPEKTWARSSAYATIDKRVVPGERLEAALAEAEREARRQLDELFAAYRSVLRSYWAEDYATTAHSLIQLGEREESVSRHGRARRLFEAALSISLPFADKAPQILALRRLGRVLLAQGELRQSSLFYLRSAELAHDAGDLRGEVVALTGSGNVLLYQGRWAEAEQQYQRALAKLEDADWESLLLERAQLYNNLGTAATRQGRLDEAEAWFAKALALWGELDSPLDLGICHHNRGLLCERRGDREQARSIFVDALRLAIPSSVRAAIATDLARCCAADGLVSQAKEWGRVAEEHAIAAQSPHVLGSMYRGLGSVASSAGDEGGITFFEKALEIARRSADVVLEGETLVDYAQLRARMGEVDEALSYLDRAREIFAALGDVGERQRADELAATLVPAPPPAE